MASVERAWNGECGGWREKKETTFFIRSKQTEAQSDG